MLDRRLFRPLYITTALALAAMGGVVLAQTDDKLADDNERSVSPVDSSGSYEVGGVEVDVTGKTADEARYAGWRIAQRKGWQMLSRRLGGGGGLVSDGTLDSIVSGIVVENENIGANRYVARLGVLFSRARAGSLLGVAGRATRSAPMLVLPLEWSGGAGVAFEQRSEWQQAWGRYRTGNSSVDYVRPSGSGPDALLLNAGQAGRRNRGWWRVILDQYGASDVLVPIVRLYRQWPGGPIIGAFQARHGPDNRLIARFTLRVGNGDALPVLLDAGVKRIDDAYQAALANGALGADPGLAYVGPPPTAETPDASATPVADGASATAAAAASEAAAVNIQFDTPGAASVEATEAALRGIPGVRSALTTSLALGGVSVMRVGFSGDPAALKAALEARGWQVQGSGVTLRIRRGGGPAPVPPPAADNTSG